MTNVFEALLELNKQMLLHNMSGPLDISLDQYSYEKLLDFMQEKYRPALFKLDTDNSVAYPTVPKWFKIAGPGGWITVKMK